MTNRERIIKTALCQETDRAPYILYLEAWDETYEKWEKEGFVPGTKISEALGYDNGFKVVQGVNLGLCPWFEEEVLEEKGDIVISRNYFGATIESIKGRETIPRFLDYPVKNMEDWQRLKAERLNPESPERFAENWAELCKEYKEGDYCIQLGDFPFGLFGTVRELMGVEEFLIAFYDQPELIHDMMDTLTDMWLNLYEKVIKDVRVDCIHIWEDMSGKQGPLISPDMMREFMVPNYQRIRKFADEHDIPFIMLDTDGNCDVIIPVLQEAGIDLLMPFEAAAGADVVRYREEHKKFAMLGGIDKQEIAKGPEAIDRELARIEPLLEENGYFPALDHLIHPDISWEDFQYYSRALKQMIDRHKKQ